MDLPALQAARPDLLEQAAAGWKSAAARFSQLSARFSAQTGALFDSPQAWLGGAADAAASSLSAISAQLTATTADMNAMSAVYSDAAMGVSGAQALLRTAQELAASSGLQIGPDGQVSFAVPALPGPLEHVAEELRAMFTQLPPAAGEVADLVAKALRLAAEVDSEVSAELARLPGSVAAVLAASALAAKIGSQIQPPDGLSARQVNDWWNALGAAAQQQLIHQFPARIGWLNGLPATARDEANRLAMQEKQASLERELAQLQAHPPPATQYGGIKLGYLPNLAYQQWLDQISSIQKQLLGIRMLQQSLSLGGKNGVPPAYLLGFSTAGNGRAIVAFGDPDTASSTVTYVPGVGATMVMSGTDAGNAVALWQQAHKLDPRQSVSSIYWLDYNAPQLSTDPLTDLQVASTGDAVDGARSLAGFQSGLAAAHGAGIGDRTVLVGHSYGSLVIGEAAAHDGVRPTDMIFVGSPGIGVGHASQLGISPSHVWAGANVNDPVPDLPRSALGELPSFGVDAAAGAVGGLISHGLSGAGHGALQGAMDEMLVTHAQNPDASFFGTNPAAPAFGGNDFNANDVPGEPSSFDMSYFESFHAHTTYWNQGSSSLRNMAAIVDGKYSQVTMAPADG